MPRAVRREKEAAQARFRAAYATSATTDDAETAARDWLEEINDVNNAARAAAATATRERAAATKIGATLEHLSLEADAARIAAETAEAACLMARQALAVCDERVDADVAQAQPRRGAGAVGGAAGRRRRGGRAAGRGAHAPAARRRSSGSCAGTATR